MSADRADARSYAADERYFNRYADGYSPYTQGDLDLVLSDLLAALRGTAVTRLAEAGCTEAEIASITGHSVKSVGAILDRYLARTKGLALSAIEKLEKSKR